MRLRIQNVGAVHAHVTQAVCRLINIFILGRALLRTRIRCAHAFSAVVGKLSS